MFELLVVIGALCLLAAGLPLFLAAAGALVWLVAFPLQVLGWIVLLPFRILGWVFGLVLALLALKLVLIGLAVAGVVVAGMVGLAALVLFPLLLLAVPVALFVRAIRGRPSHPTPS